MKRSRVERTMAVVFVLALGGCASQAVEETGAPAAKVSAQEPTVAQTPAPAPVAKEPAAKERLQPVEPPPSKGAQLLAQGVKSYEDGDYRSAAKQFEAALREPLSGTEKALAHKYLAFVACVSGRAATCRNHFRKAIAAEANFDLAAAEKGHPVWGPAFRSVKAEIAAKAKKAKPTKPER